MRTFMIAICLLVSALCAAHAQLIANFNISGGVRDFTPDKHNPDVIYAEGFEATNYSALAFSYKTEKVLWKHTFAKAVYTQFAYSAKGVAVYHHQLYLVNASITFIEKASGAIMWDVPVPKGLDGDQLKILTGKAYDSHGVVVDVLFYTTYNYNYYLSNVWAIELSSGNMLWNFRRGVAADYFIANGASKRLPGIVLSSTKNFMFVDGHGKMTAFSNITGRVTAVTEDFKVIARLNTFSEKSSFEAFDATKNFTKSWTIPSANVKDSYYNNFYIAPDHADLAYISLSTLNSGGTRGETLMNLTTLKPVWTNNNINKYLTADQAFWGFDLQEVGGDGNLYFSVYNSPNTTVFKMDGKTGDILKIRNGNYWDDVITAEGIWLGEYLIDLGNKTYITNVQAQKF